MQKIIKDEIDRILDNDYAGFEKDSHYEYEMYADYRDELDDKTIKKILESKRPWYALWEKLEGVYDYTRAEYEQDLIDHVRISIRNNQDLEDILLEEDEDEVADYIREKVWFVIPMDHYLKQRVHATIVVDTGDGNHDYTLNSVYPGYSGQKGERIHPKASLRWLTKQQGHTIAQLQNILKNGPDHKIDYAKGENNFLDSVYVEVLNEASHMNALVFLVDITLDQLGEINELMREQTAKYDMSENPECGTVILDKSVLCGLYDAWSGGGSVLEIFLEKDVELPIKYIKSALPDSVGNGYSVQEVYGLCGSAWKDAVKAIKGPRKKAVS